MRGTEDMLISAVDGMAVIDMRTAVLATQSAADAFKALEEDADYASNLEEAQSEFFGLAFFSKDGIKNLKSCYQEIKNDSKYNRPSRFNTL